MIKIITILFIVEEFRYQVLFEFEHDSKKHHGLAHVNTAEVGTNVDTIMVNPITLAACQASKAEKIHQMTYPVM